MILITGIKHVKYAAIKKGYIRCRTNVSFLIG